MENNNKRIEEAMDMMMEKQIDINDYKLIKSHYKRENQKLIRDKVRLQGYRQQWKIPERMRYLFERC